MNLLSLTTDYGTREFYLASLKAELYKNVPELTLIDMTHDIPMDRLALGAYQLRSAIPSFPSNAMHLVCINEFLEDNQELLIARRGSQWIVAPNNGFLTLLYDTYDFGPVQHEGGKTSRERWAYISQVIYGLCHQYGYVERLNPPSVLIQRYDIHPIVNDSTIRTKVYHIDRFGNVVLNVRKSLFDQVGQSRDFKIECRNYTYTDGLYSHLNAVEVGEITCTFNEGNYLQLSAFQQKADELLGLSLDDTVNVLFKDA